MDLAHETESGAAWYVTNGDAVIGPIATDLLLRGVATSRIPEYCLVAQASWTRWRELRHIREFSRSQSAQRWTCGEKELVESGLAEDLVKRAPDAGEALLYAMQAAVNATRASSALVHRAREPFVGLVTSSAHGRGVEAQLGEVIAHHDASFEQACLREVIMGDPQERAATRAIARRFARSSDELAGVAMVPVYDGATLLAMIELARVDHPFRARDAQILVQIAEVVCAR